ncbi:NIPSNAP family protein [Methylobacterium persicinum]
MPSPGGGPGRPGGGVLGGGAGGRGRPARLLADGDRSPGPGPRAAGLCRAPGHDDRAPPCPDERRSVPGWRGDHRPRDGQLRALPLPAGGHRGRARRPVRVPHLPSQARGLPPTLAAWEAAIAPAQEYTRHLVTNLYALDGPPRITHVWAFDSLEQRAHLRETHYANGTWPPKGGPDQIAEAMSVIALPVAGQALVTRKRS